MPACPVRKDELSESPPRDRSPHEPVGKVRTGLHSVHKNAFGSSHIKAGSRAFDVMFRFVGGVSLGTALASIARGGGGRGIEIIRKWPHHPFSDGVALGFIIGVILAPLVYFYFRGCEKRAHERGLPAPQFRWIGRKTALFVFALGFLILFLMNAESVDMRPARWR
jgi:hypothetical protein